MCKQKVKPPGPALCVGGTTVQIERPATSVLCKSDHDQATHFYSDLETQAFKDIPITSEACLQIVTLIFCYISFINFLDYPQLIEQINLAITQPRLTQIQ